MKKTILVITCLVFSVAFLRADYYIKTQTNTPAIEMMGQKTPEKKESSEQWLGKDRVAMVSSKQTVVLDLTVNKMYFIYHAKKTYVETTLPLDMSKLIPKEMAAMAGMMKVSIKVSPTGQSKTIKGKKCEGYNIDMKMPMMNSQVTAWVTTDLPFDWKSYSEKMYATFMNATMPFLDANSIAEYKKMKGIQMAQEMKMSIMGKEIVTTSEVVEIGEKAAPDGLYAVPAGYKKADNIIMSMGK